MSYKCYFVVYLVVLKGFLDTEGRYEVVEVFNQNYISNNLVDRDLYDVKSTVKLDEKVEIKLFYECLCPDCIEFYTTQFLKVIEELNNFLNIYTYPYGNARTFINNDIVTFKCQHGSAECYGNKLHACAIDKILNKTQALLYNACMMHLSPDSRGSDDAAADKCATHMNLDSTLIKECANGQRGTQLLTHYGEESKKINFHYVPYIMINGIVNDGNNFLKDVCAAFKIPPSPCLKYQHKSIGWRAISDLDFP